MRVPAVGKHWHTGGNPAEREHPSERVADFGKGLLEQLVLGKRHLVGVDRFRGELEVQAWLVPRRPLVWKHRPTGVRIGFLARNEFRTEHQEGPK